jgi:hypothetical protein
MDRNTILSLKKKKLILVVIAIGTQLFKWLLVGDWLWSPQLGGFNRAD